MEYYTDIININPIYIGWIYVFYNLWNAINDPLLGVFVDRFKFKVNKGKYVYLMRVTAPIMLLAIFGMLFSSPSWSDWIIFLVLLVELFIFDTAYTVYSINWFGYDGNAAVQTEQAILGIRISAGLVPLTMIAIGFIPLLMFPIGKTQEKEISEYRAKMRRGTIS